MRGYLWLPLIVVACVANVNTTEPCHKLWIVADVYQILIDTNKWSAGKCRECYLGIPKSSETVVNADDYQETSPCGNFVCYQLRKAPLEVLVRRCLYGEIHCNASKKHIPKQLNDQNTCLDLSNNLTLPEYESIFRFDNVSSNVFTNFNTSTEREIYRKSNDRFIKFNKTSTKTDKFISCQENLFNITAKTVFIFAHAIILVTSDESDDFIICKENPYLDWCLFTLMLCMLVPSVLGLVLTAVTIFALGELKSVPGLNLMCLILSLAVAFCCLPICVLQCLWQQEHKCQMLKVLHVYALFAGMFWMSVMGFDIQQSLSSLNPVNTYLCMENKIRLSLYWAYSWGGPALLLSAGIYLDNDSDVNTNLKPHFVRNCCFGHNRTLGRFLLYHFPIGLLFIGNAILFLSTAKILRKARRIREEMLSMPDSKHCYTFWLHLKLFLVLGLTWVTESSKFFSTSFYYDLICDCINSLQGVFIFAVFCCNGRIFRQVREKWTKRPSSSGSGSTQRQSVRSSHLETKQSCGNRAIERHRQQD